MTEHSIRADNEFDLSKVKAAQQQRASANGRGAICFVPSKTLTMKITAPFTPAQVQTLNERQCHVAGSMPIHPFSCPNRGDGITYDAVGVADDAAATHGTEGGDRGILIATEDGWVCPSCGYRQDWAYAAMAASPEHMGHMFKAFPTLAEIFGTVSPGLLDQMIARYRTLAEDGKLGADVMWLCLERRRMAVDAAANNKVREVHG